MFCSLFFTYPYMMNATHRKEGAINLLTVSHYNIFLYREIKTFPAPWLEINTFSTWLLKRRQSHGREAATNLRNVNEIKVTQCPNFKPQQPNSQYITCHLTKISHFNLFDLFRHPSWATRLIPKNNWRRKSKYLSDPRNNLTLGGS